MDTNIKKWTEVLILRDTVMMSQRGTFIRKAYTSHHSIKKQGEPNILLTELKARDGNYILKD